MIPNYTIDAIENQSYNFDIRQGSVFQAKLNLKDDDGLPYDLDGYTGIGYISSHYGNTGTRQEFIVDFEIPDSGVVNLFLLPSQTESLPVTKMLHEFKLSGLSAEIGGEPISYKFLNGKSDIYPQNYV